VDTKTEIREFLISRRARITPEQAGLPIYGNGPRRVPGLRREEVALLAGVSIAYYTKLERGDTAGVSEPVLDSLARALQLDEAERAHLFDLARAQRTSPQKRRRRARQQVRPNVQRILDAMTGVPAYVRNGRGDLLAANQLGEALFSELYADPARPVNTACFVFLDPRAPAFFPDWDRVAADVVGALHAEAGRDPTDRDLTGLVGQLATQSEAFRMLWAMHNVHVHDSGVKRLHHPLVGELTLTYEAMELAANPGLTIAVYTAEPGSKSEEALNLLASWTATLDEAQIADPADR
jgi:transcriptional regulator with XRE-family HTH domain